MLKNLYNRIGDFSKGKNSYILLSVLFAIESIFFFIPVDPILIIYCCENRKKSIFYATIATMSSVIGGIVAYFIGSIFWDLVGQNIILYFSSIDTFEKVVSYYTRYENLAVLIAAFTPIPYKVVTLTAGFCKLPFLPFVIFSIIGRGLRFFLIAILIRLFGDKIKNFIDQYFNLLVVLFMFLILLTLFVFK